MGYDLGHDPGRHYGPFPYRQESVSTHGRQNLCRADKKPTSSRTDFYILLFCRRDQIMPLLGLEEFIRSRSDSTKAILAIFFAKESLFIQFISGVFTIAFFEGAYITEIIRAGIESVERGQREAAYSLGLSWFDQMRFIIMPQAIKRVLPPLANEFINTIKYSSLASVVSIQELTFMGRQVIVATRYIFETWITVALMYLTLTLSLSLVVGRLEKKMGQSD
jgi:polar amino acid transport system permease protein